MCGILFALSERRSDGGNAFTDEEMEIMKDLLASRGPDAQGIARDYTNEHEICIIATLLQLRGKKRVQVPLQNHQGNILAFNGQLFGGIDVEADENDAESLFRLLERTCEEDIAVVLSKLRGPWSLVYWRRREQIVWIGRDVLGRRSLLVHYPNEQDKRLILASVVLEQQCMQKSNTRAYRDSWEELPTGIYRLDLGKGTDLLLKREILDRLQWTCPTLKKLDGWVRQESVPALHEQEVLDEQRLEPYVDALLEALKEAVKKRVSNIRLAPPPVVLGRVMPAIRPAQVAILFSGGVDSALLSLLAHETMEEHAPIDLLNVCFAEGNSPDRHSAISALHELMVAAPSREWRFVEIDGELSKIDECRPRLIRLLDPSNTYMDLNIGAALWIAAEGRGRLFCSQGGTMIRKEGEYRSAARVLLVGHGIDEQCAGYGRHRTRFRRDGWHGLEEELRIDMKRLWKRNLGRDDRILSDHGKEARHPYLDETVMEQLLDTPMRAIADLRLPQGKGDKRLLRACAYRMGLHECSTRTKRAIQFGTRIAKRSNEREYGSNRAANLAKAGSARIKHEHEVEGT